MAEDAWTFVGRRVDPDALDLVKTLMGEFGGLSREELAATVCEWLGWTRATGRMKTRECREWLEHLEAAGVIALPAKRGGRPVGARTTVPVTARGDARSVVTGTVRDIRPVEVVRVRTSEEHRLFRELVGRYHYLGYAVPFGAHLRYLIYAARPPQVVGCLQYSSPAWRLACRDGWIGWDDATRARNLGRVVNNSRLLIVPWVRVKNLASTLLAQAAAVIGPDWEATYGARPVLLETFVDPTRFAGTCYRAANWVLVGHTRGRGRRGPSRPTRSAKCVFLYPVAPDAVARLREA